MDRGIYSGSSRVVASAALTLLVGAVALPAAAEDHRNGYVVNPYGEVVRTGYGECWRSRFPAQEDQTEYARECGDLEEGPEEEMAEAAPADSDGDGVADGQDACPGTPAGSDVDEMGCVPDEDGDGVPDSADACLRTEPGRTVDARGCPVEASIEVTLSGANFASDSAELPDSLKPQLDELVRRIRDTAGTEQLEIVGYTDSLGDADYNEELSERRAQAVADYLYERGIDRFMMDVSGRGEADPVASNDTAAGRAENRRVEISTE
jgi:OOP family OmpA-OmpF porin